MMYVDKRALAQYLGVSISKIDRMIVDGMPKLKIGYSVRFNPEEVVRWIQEHYSQEDKR